MRSLRLPAEHLALLAQIAEFLAAQHAAAWLVGGYVRDLVLAQSSEDIDIAVDGSALDLARTLADQTGGAYVLLDAPTESARIVWGAADESPPLIVDLIRLRAPTIVDDLRLRDFTINALALPLNQLAAVIASDTLLDPTDGLSDLKAGLIRLCGPTALTDDPLRALRAVRFAAQLNFQIAPETDGALREHATLINRVSPERVREELLKFLAAPHVAPWLAYLDDVRLLTQIIPELDAARDCQQPPEHFLPVLGHLFETVCAWEWLYAQLQDRRQATEDAGETNANRPFVVPAAVQRYPDLDVALPYADRIVARMEQKVMAGHRRSTLFKLAALLHDVGKPMTRAVKPNGRITFYDHPEQGAKIAGRLGLWLRLSREAEAYLRLIVGEHMRPGQLRALGSGLTRRAVYRLLRDTRDAAPDVLLHSLCDHMAARGPHLSPADWQRHVAWTGALLEDFWGSHQRVPQARLITGDDVVRNLGVPPGPIVGRVLAAVDEARFLGDINSREEALALAEQIVRGERSAP